MMSDWQCECSFDDGPCEDHGELLVQRAGASNRTADELLQVFIADAMDLGAELSPYGQQVYDEACQALGEDRWITDRDLAEALDHLAFQVESYLADLVVTWEDGYTIVRPSEDCPLYV